MRFHTLYWFLRLLLISPHSSRQQKQPRFRRGLQDLPFQRCYYHSAGQTVRKRSGRAHSFWNMQKHTCLFFFTHAFKILWDLTFVFISTNRTTAPHDLSTSHSLPLFEWIAVPLLYFENTFLTTAFESCDPVTPHQCLTVLLLQVKRTLYFLFNFTASSILHEGVNRHFSCDPMRLPFYINMNIFC